MMNTCEKYILSPSISIIKSSKISNRTSNIGSLKIYPLLKSLYKRDHTKNNIFRV